MTQIREHTVVANHDLGVERVEAVDWHGYFGHHLNGARMSANRFFGSDTMKPHSTVSFHGVENVTISRFFLKDGSGGIRIEGTSGGEDFAISLWDTHV